MRPKKNAMENVVESFHWGWLDSFDRGDLEGEKWIFSKEGEGEGGESRMKGGEGTCRTSTNNWWKFFNTNF